MARLARFCLTLAAPMMVAVTSVDAQQTTAAASMLAAVQSMDVQVAPTSDSAAIEAPGASVPNTAPISLSSTAPVAPAAAAQAVALRMRTSTEAPAPAPIPQARRTNAAALMVVGLAGVVTGLVVGDEAGTILVLAGAGVGLYGLYKWMQ